MYGWPKYWQLLLGVGWEPWGPPYLSLLWSPKKVKNHVSTQVWIISNWFEPFLEFFFPQIKKKRPAVLILSLRVKMLVLLEFGHFCLVFFKFTAGLIRIRVLFEGGSLSRIYGVLKIAKKWVKYKNFAIFDIH